MRWLQLGCGWACIPLGLGPRSLPPPRLPHDTGSRGQRLPVPLPLPQEHARYANGGAYPPDLSLITKVGLMGGCFSSRVPVPADALLSCAGPTASCLLYPLFWLDLCQYPSHLPTGLRPTPRASCQSSPQARHDGQNYVFSLLLGYREPPAGITVRGP